MSKDISTLIEDIYDVIKGKGGWTNAVNEYFKERVAETTANRFGETEERPKGTLRMSSIGQPCERKFWYDINLPEDGEELRAPTLLKFAYGDILEDLLLSLAVAAGHTVEGHQDTMEIKGVKGHRDAVIDGVTIDVKSASPASFKKFQAHGLETEDPFGYLWQLSSYVFAAKDDPLVKDKKGGAFLAIDKVNGTLCLDYYNFEDTGHLDKIEDFYDRRKEVSASTAVPPRGFWDEPEGKSGNRKLIFNCAYCPFKNTCWPTMRTFVYARGPVYLTKVVREPNVPEVK